MNEDPRPRKLHPLERGPYTPQNTGTTQQAPQPPRERLILNQSRAMPYLTYGLVAINVAIYVLSSLLLPNLQQTVRLFGWNFAPAIFGDGEYYRFVTSMFLHGDPLHILFNAYALYILGPTTEQVFGKGGFLGIYFLGGITGSLLSAAFGDPAIPSLGASGAVFALLGAQIVYFWRYRNELGSYGRGVLNHYLFLAGLNLVFGFSIPNIDNLGHIGGMIGGVATALLALPVLKMRQQASITGLTARIVEVRPAPTAQVVRGNVLYAIALVGATMFAAFTFSF